MRRGHGCVSPGGAARGGGCRVTGYRAAEKGRRATSDPDPFEAGAAFWTRVADPAAVFAPLFFELSSHAMRGAPARRRTTDWLRTGWTSALRDAYLGLGMPAARADTLALQSLAMARGLLFEVAVTGDRAAADEALAR